MRSWKFSKSLSSVMFFRKGSSVLTPGFDSSLSRDANSTVLRLKWGTATILPMNLCGSWRTHLQSQSELYHVSRWYYTLVVYLIGQLRRDAFGRLSVKPWCYSGLRSPGRSNSTYYWDLHYIEDIARWREDMNFIFEWQNNIYERAQRVSKILFLPQEIKIHIFKPPCNVLFII